MKYNEKYDLFVDDDLVIYRLDKRLDKLVQVKQAKSKKGYMCVCTKLGVRFVHRVIWETFRYEIPDGMQLDHINTIRDDNRLENLRCVTQKENSNNPLTRKHISKACKGKGKGKHPWNYEKTHSEFGKMFKEHFGFTHRDNPRLYTAEYNWYIRHNKKYSWEE